MNFRRIALIGVIAVFALGGAYWTSRKLVVSGAIGSEEQKGVLGLKLEPQVLDLGTVMVNRDINFTTLIRNYGQESIKLARIEKSCGCTSVQVAKDTCQPGENVELKGNLHPRKPGKFRHLVKLFEAGALGQEHILEVTGEAQTSICVFPDSILLKPSVFENKAVEQVIVFKNNSDDRATVREPMNLPEGISVRIPKGEVGSKQELKVVIRAEPRFFVDTDVSLSFPTNHSTQDNVELNLQLRPENGFSVVPNTIRLGVVSKKDLEKAPVRLSLIGPNIKNVAITRIVAPSFLKLSKEATRNDDRMEIEFAFSMSQQGISMRGAIRVELEVGVQGQRQKQTVELNVPISGLVRD
jgi:hypothetical protein